MPCLAVYYKYMEMVLNIPPKLSVPYFTVRNLSNLPGNRCSDILMQKSQRKTVLLRYKKEHKLGQFWVKLLPHIIS